MEETVSLADYRLQLPAWSLENLKTAAVEQRLMRPRSLAWAIMLNTVPLPPGDIVMSMRCHRNFYEDLKTKLSMDPRAVIDDDPLSQNDESAWNQHFCDNELKALILQDVVRTYPDEEFYREKQIEDIMIRVLFFWARSHSNIGYRQGMHEILAPLLLELHTDRQLAPNDLCDTLKCFLDESYLEHDSYMLFSSVMKGLEKFYTTGDVVPTSCGRFPTSTAVHNPNEVVRYLEKVKEEYLVQCDSELATHLANLNISMEIFGIRWLRLLFGREFSRSEIPQLWGFIFSDGPMLPNLHYIIVALLISMRSSLLSAEVGEVLSALMRAAPAPAPHVCALALHLRSPRDHPRPRPPPPRPAAPAPAPPPADSGSAWSLELRGVEATAASEASAGSEGVAEGADVARSLAALALLRARLPPAAAALARALPRPPPDAHRPLHQILQLAALLQCRNHALIDVETALEAAEGQTAERVGRKQLVPVSMIGGRRAPAKQAAKLGSQVKEVPLTVFHQMECSSASDLPYLDPLRLRTE